MSDYDPSPFLDDLCSCFRPEPKWRRLVREARYLGTWPRRWRYYHRRVVVWGGHKYDTWVSQIQPTWVKLGDELLIITDVKPGVIKVRRPDTWMSSSVHVDDSSGFRA